MNNPQIDSEGNKYWRNENGLLHREDGPSVEYASGDKLWSIEGQYYSEESKWKEALEVYCLNKGIKSIFTIQKETEEEKQKEQLRIIEFPKEYETIEL